jgi:hypothetical protein
MTLAVGGPSEGPGDYGSSRDSVKLATTLPGQMSLRRTKSGCCSLESRFVQGANRFTRVREGF